MKSITQRSMRRPKRDQRPRTQSDSPASQAQDWLIPLDLSMDKHDSAKSVGENSTQRNTPNSFASMEDSPSPIVGKRSFSLGDESQSRRVRVKNEQERLKLKQKRETANHKLMDALKALESQTHAKKKSSHGSRSKRGNDSSHSLANRMHRKAKQRNQSQCESQSVSRPSRHSIESQKQEGKLMPMFKKDQVNALNTDIFLNNQYEDAKTKESACSLPLKKQNKYQSTISLVYDEEKLNTKISRSEMQDSNSLGMDADFEFECVNSTSPVSSSALLSTTVQDLDMDPDFLRAMVEETEAVEANRKAETDEPKMLDSAFAQKETHHVLPARSFTAPPFFGCSNMEVNNRIKLNMSLLIFFLPPSLFLLCS